MKSHDAVQRKLKTFGLAYPEAHSKSPWPGHDDLAVRNKTFAFLSAAGEPLRITCKLPLTGEMAAHPALRQPDRVRARPERLGHGDLRPEGCTAPRPARGLDRRKLSRTGTEEARRKLARRSAPPCTEASL